MTYEELQDENRRLRARIHGLEQNPQNIVLGPDAFLPILTGDIEAAQSLVVLSCESLHRPGLAFYAISNSDGKIGTRLNRL